MSTTRTRRVRKVFLMSGWCNPSNPPESHKRCIGYNNSNPDKEYQACPCACHLGEEYECGGCGKVIREAPYLMPLFSAPDPDDPEDDGMVFTHTDPTDGRATGEDC